VLQEACRRGAAWHSQGYRFTVSVNISAKQLERDRIVDDVRAALSASGFDPSKLVLELTETSLMHDVEATIPRLKALKMCIRDSCSSSSSRDRGRDFIAGATTRNSERKRRAQTRS